MKLFVKRDVDGFFGLFVDNIVQLLVIILFCRLFCGMTGEDSRLLYEVILPGTAISVLFGNIFYAWQAHRLARKTGREDVTALPYGINTPSVIVYVFFVMAPEFARTQSSLAAWKLGLVACLGSGIIELCGSFVAGSIRRSTPRAALLSTLAGIAIGFISMTFTLQIFHKPLIAMLPLMLVLIGLFSHVRLPLSLPSGFVAVLIGTLIAWGLTGIQQVFPTLPGWLTFGSGSVADVRSSLDNLGWMVPQWSWEAIAETLQNVESWLPMLTVIVPMGLFNVIGSMQNIESAEAAGDSYATAPSMAVNGLGTILAALLGSCFPTTIYIGHPGWKAMGARAGYSTLNGIVIVGICLTGLVSPIASIVPIEVGAGIVLWIGVIITAQAFSAVPSTHGTAVAVGLFPAIAAWGATVMLGTVIAAGGNSLQQILTSTVAASEVSEDPIADDEPPSPQAAVGAASSGFGAIQLFGQVAVNEDMPEVLEDSETETATTAPDAAAALTAGSYLPRWDESAKSSSEVNGFLVHGLLLMERGYIFTCMILAAVSACLVDRKFIAAGVWLLIAALLTFCGMMHAYQIYSAGPIELFDYLFRFVDAQPGAYTYRANDLVLAYLISGLFLIGFNRWAILQPDEPAGH